MSKKKVVVELHAGRIDVTVYDGARRDVTRRLDIDAPDDPNEWATVVRRSAASLRRFVEELEIAGAAATVLYRSPTQVVDMSGVEVRSPAAAMEAAILGSIDALPYSALSAVTEAVVVGRDAGGDSPRTHVVIAAEREDIAEAIVSLIEESGLTAASVTPIDAAVTAKVLGEELRRKASHASFYIGANSSLFIAAKDSRILFSRRIDLGLAAVSASLTRPINIAGRGEPVELSLSDARAILLAHGVAPRDRIVHPQLKLTGAHVLPLLQPVLQRFIVELRQSLRFGLDESERADLSIDITGPGAAIPGFAELIGEELGVETTRNAAYDPVNIDDPSYRCELTDALSVPRLLTQLNLLPQAVSTERRTSRLRRWMWTGSAAAIVVVAADGVRTHAQLGDARRENANYQAQLSDLGNLEQKGTLLQTVLVAQRQLDERIDEEIGARVEFPACMKELARLTPESIRLSAVSFGRQAGVMSASISGCALDLDGEGARNELEVFIDRLRRSPLFADVVLGHVSRGSLGKREGQQFTASFRLVEVPWRALEIVAADPADGRVEADP